MVQVARQLLNNLLLLSCEILFLLQVEGVDHEILWEEFACTRLEHSHDSRLIVEALITELLYNNLDPLLNQLKDPGLDLSQE